MNSLFEEQIRGEQAGAARHVDRHAQLLFRGGQGPDHPVHPAIAETRYLKALLYRISPAL